MKILKFGGTSLANAKLFLRVVNIIEKSVKKEQTGVVLSAPAKITNYLADIIESKIYDDSMLKIVFISENIFFQLIKDITNIQLSFPYKEVRKIIQKEFNKLKKIVKNIILAKKCPESIQAIVLSRGEILSVIIMKNILKSKKYKITVIDPIKNILSIGNYLDAKVDINQSKTNIENININKNDIVLMPGFIGGNEKKELVLLGRNGSDYSAAILSVCLNAKLCEIWTDVDGVFTADPRKVLNSYLLKQISYQEAIELSYFGAAVLHPRTIKPLKKFKIPCLIKNTTNTQSKGTLISQENDVEENHLKGITHLDDITMITLPGFIINNEEKKILSIVKNFSKKNIKIILITQSSAEKNISFCTFEKNIDKILILLKQNFKSKCKDILNYININKNLSILSIIGSCIYKKNNFLSKIFFILDSLKINIFAIAQGSSRNSISIVIKKKNILKAVQNVHNILFSKKKIINAFLIGIGGVGRALLNQIIKQKKVLDKKNIKIKVCAIANSKKILFENSINLKNWQEIFDKSKEKFNLEKLNSLLINNSHSNSVIIDCTSDQYLSQQYVHFLSKGFHIVTSNKKANTDSFKYYNEIRNTAFLENKKFFYETNVGAGLPVIKTLQNLFNTGDKLISFKGILSGSLSFIFGKLEEGLLLSEATKEAKKRGFTEPNPYDDLSGIDVARKLLVLAREAGHSIELKDIKIEPILPKSFQQYNNAEELLFYLKELDAQFLHLIKKSRNEKCVLRFVGTIEKEGSCSVKIEKINKKDPLYHIKNGENALTFYTNYYQPIPLVLRGYGAGNDVTASGVFSDLLHTIL